MMARYGIFGALIRIRKLSLLLVVTLRMPNTLHLDITSGGSFAHKLIDEGRVILERILENTP